MDPDRFHNSTAGRALRQGQGQAAYWAFLPHPLPPALEIDWALASALSEADRALSQLAGVGRTMPNPHLLIGPFVRREAVLSSRIEGTQADLADLYAYQVGQLPLPGLAPSPSESDVREVHNYVTALEYGLERLATLPVSLRLVRELHERLMSGVCGEYATPGEFRRSQNWIGPPGCTLNDAPYVPPPVPQMHEALHAFEAYLHAEGRYPPLVRLALVHYQFEAIHPFLDGNGRVGRLLLSLLLIEWGLLSLPLLYLSAYFYRRRQAYYGALTAVSERGAWNQWLLYFLKGVTEQSLDAIERANKLQDLQIVWRERLTQDRTPARLLRLADHLFSAPMIGIPQIQRVLEVSYPTAQRYVNKLVELGIVRQLGASGYDRTFVAHEIMAIVETGIESERN